MLTDPDDTPPTAGGRFTIVGLLGRGGMGIVHEAIDRETGEHVALKTLGALDPASVLRFKQEFRSLSGIHHPGLVRLGELFEDEGRFFFTMEVVRGVPLLDYVRTSPKTDPPKGVDEEVSQVRRSTPLSRAPRMAPVGYDEERLRRSFGELAQALVALHAAGRVHRDIKPSNVLVSEGGRVVLLDFGLVTEVAADEPDNDVVGTPHYMAPEQAAGTGVGPAADWYAVGVMLYRALTGKMPLAATAMTLLLMKQRVDAEPPSRVVPSIPADLDELAADLLRRAPNERPTGTEVLRRLGLSPEREQERKEQSAPVFVGREAELATLHGLWAATTNGGAAAVLVRGESGVGKTALVRRFLRDLPQQTLILRSQCLERNAVPFNAVDELVDGIARRLTRLSDVEVKRLLPENTALLESVFPVLGLARCHMGAGTPGLGSDPRDPASRSTPPPSSPTGRTTPIMEAPAASAARGPIDARVRRDLVFSALHDLVAQLSAPAGLVMVVDDLQWADADSLALLPALLRGQSTPVLLIATLRPTVAGMPNFSGVASHVLDLGRLGPGDARRLAAALLNRTPGPPRDDARIAADAGGHPLWIDALVRERWASFGEARAQSLDEALFARVARLPELERDVVKLVAVAGGPVRLDVLRAALAVDADDLAAALVLPAADHLVRVTGRGARVKVEPFHDRVREAVVDRLDAAERRSRNAQLARALERGKNADPERLSLHFFEAGMSVEAAVYAKEAAERAARALAFEHAITLFQRAIELSSGEDPLALGALLEGLGDALSLAGRERDAARAYLQASRLGAPNASSLRRRAAESYLRSGFVDEGLATLRVVAAEVGLRVPQNRAEALLSLLAARTRLRVRGLAFRMTKGEHAAPAVLNRIDVGWSASLGLAMVDSAVASSFQTQTLMASLDLGEPYRVARSLAFEASFLSTEGHDARQRCAQLLALSHSIARQIKNDHALGLAAMGTGIVAYCLGQFRESLQALDGADRIFRERCRGVAWERASTGTFATWDLWLAGDIPELLRRMPIYLGEAEARGDRYFATNLRSCFSNAYWLALDQPQEARREAASSIHCWSALGFQMQHFLDYIARGQIALYEGRAAEHHLGIDAEWQAVRASLTLRMQVARIFSLHLRARTALAAAKERGRAERLREAEHFTARLARENAPWAAPLGASLRAGIAAAKGRPVVAIDELLMAMRGFDEHGMGLFATAARRCYGALLGGDEGRAFAQAAEASMKESQIRSPARTTAMLLPGFSID